MRPEKAFSRYKGRRSRNIPGGPHSTAFKDQSFVSGWDSPAGGARRPKAGWKYRIGLHLYYDAKKRRIWGGFI